MSEKLKFLKWEALGNTEKHMILMYLYRVETEPPEELNKFIETYRFKSYGIKREDLPSWYLNLHPEKLKAVAYEVIGIEYVPKIINEEVLNFKTMDFSNYLPEVNQ